MKQTQETQFVMRSCLADHRLETLRALEQELELCQKALNDYLDGKRNAFPRFYFISDDEVLNILGGKEAEAIQEHIVKASGRDHIYPTILSCLTSIFFSQNLIWLIIPQLPWCMFNVLGPNVTIGDLKLLVDNHYWEKEVHCLFLIKLSRFV